MVGLHLFMPDEWTESAQRCDLAGVPEMAREPRTKGKIALAEGNLPIGSSVRSLAAAIKARWVSEQAHQQLKGKSGLGHFEGRSSTGLHRHALMTCIALAYLQHLRLARHRRMRRGKMNHPVPGSPPTPSLPTVRQSIIGRLFAHLMPCTRFPHCKQRFKPSPDLKVPK